MFRLKWYNIGRNVFSEESNMKKVRFIHAADLHLDSPFRGLKDIPDALYQQAKECTFVALQKLTKHAIDNEVDFILLAGDLFDGENRSFKAQFQLKKALELLDYHNISCYIIHGNHDHLNGNWISINWPKNVFFFKDEVDFYQYKKNEMTVHIYGYSYPEKSVKQSIVSNYRKIGSADFHIGLLHGTANGQEGHDLYAPFSVNQLLEKDFDYWALGHIHKRQVLYQEPYIIYPGNTQGRHKKELGEKGVYLVELAKEESTNVTFLPTSQIIWEEISISIDGLNEIEELKNLCEFQLEEASKDQYGLFAVFHFIGRGPLHEFIIEQVDELIDVINANQENKLIFSYVVDKKIDTAGEWDRQQLKNERHLLTDIITVVDRLNESEEPLQKMLEEAYTNSKLKRYLDPFTTEEQKQLIKEAEDYLLATLLKERKE